MELFKHTHTQGCFWMVLSSFHLGGFLHSGAELEPQNTFMATSLLPFPPHPFFSSFPYPLLSPFLPHFLLFIHKKIFPECLHTVPCLLKIILALLFFLQKYNLPDTREDSYNQHKCPQEAMPAFPSPQRMKHGGKTVTGGAGQRKALLMIRFHSQKELSSLRCC